MLTLGDVEILPEQRQVFVRKQPFNLGSRAFDLLELLARANGALVSKEEIMRQVWPNTVVVENNLHVHISAIRKMLGVQKSRLVAVPGRGYRLVVAARETGATSLPVSLPATPGLPLANASIIGRDQAIDDVLAACQSGALVSVVGPGGVGKTTLAMEVARRQLPDFADGVRLIELAEISDSSEVVSATLRSLGGCRDTGQVSAGSVVQALGQRRMLIVLDNCEHVIQAAASLALAIIAGAPNCKVLVTSREALRVPAEVVYRVAPLDLPHQQDSTRDTLQCSAVRLFIDRAKAVERQFACDAADVALIGQVCRRLDGMPLAIELAALRAATLGIRELVANLDDRFQLLTSGHRTALPQHRALRATFDWSYALLSPAQQTVFRRLGVFSSAFSMEAACAVAADNAISEADVLDAVCALIAKSLVMADTRQSGARYSLLETCRAYAITKLDEHGERESVGRRNGAFAGGCVKPLASSRELTVGHFRQHADTLQGSHDWTFGDPFSGRGEHVPTAAFQVIDPVLLRAIANREPV